MIDPNTETLVSLTEAARLLPSRRGMKRTHVSCMYRWTNSGCRGVILESIQIGGTRCTSREALARFFETLTEAARGRPAAQPPLQMTTGRLPTHRRHQIEAAQRRLREAGISSPAPDALPSLPATKNHHPRG